MLLPPQDNRNPYLTTRIIESRIRPADGTAILKRERALTSPGQDLHRQLFAFVDSMSWAGFGARLFISMSLGPMIALAAHWLHGRYLELDVWFGALYMLVWMSGGCSIAYIAAGIWLGRFRRKLKNVRERQVDFILSTNRGLYDAIEIVHPELTSQVADYFGVKPEWRL